MNSKITILECSEKLSRDVEQKLPGNYAVETRWDKEIQTLDYRIKKMLEICARVDKYLEHVHSLVNRQ